MWQGSLDARSHIVDGHAARKRQDKGAGKKRDSVQKLENHLLGGQTVGDVLFMDAWSEAATQLKEKLELQMVYRISGIKLVHQSPRNSTSRLNYFLSLIHI